LFPSSSFLTVEIHNRFLDRISRSNTNLLQQNANIVPNSGHNPGVALKESINRALGSSISSSSPLARTPQWFPDRHFGSNAPRYQGDAGNNPSINLELSLSLT